MAILERFSNDCRKTKTIVITPTNHNSIKQHDDQSQFLAINCNLLKAREKSRAQGAIGFRSHWLKRWRENLIRQPLSVVIAKAIA